jgi:hypothetical protein
MKHIEFHHIPFIFSQPTNIKKLCHSLRNYYIMLIKKFTKYSEVLNMAKKTSKNNDLLYNSKDNASPQIYSLLIDLVNQDKEDLAQVVIKVDYLLEYASRCIKQKDFEEANEGLIKAKTRIDMLKTEEVNTEYLEYLYTGIAKKAKQ